VAALTAHPDGARFLMLLAVDPEPATVILVKNWLQDVERRLGRQQRTAQAIPFVIGSAAHARACAELNP